VPTSQRRRTGSGQLAGFLSAADPLCAQRRAVLLKVGLIRSLQPKLKMDYTVGFTQASTLSSPSAASW
jgi:hypothetical protein